MPKVTLDAIAPDFTLEDYSGQAVTLSGFQEEKNVLLVFNRTFM